MKKFALCVAMHALLISAPALAAGEKIEVGVGGVISKKMLSHQNVTGGISAYMFAVCSPGGVNPHIHVIYVAGGAEAGGNSSFELYRGDILSVCEESGDCFPKKFTKLDNCIATFE